VARRPLILEVGGHLLVTGDRIHHFQAVPNATTEPGKYLYPPGNVDVEADCDEAIFLHSHPVGPGQLSEADVEAARLGPDDPALWAIYSLETDRIRVWQITADYVYEVHVFVDGPRRRRRSRYAARPGRR
jgi:proteasome lid subunit RPN8/RPN11